MNEAGSGIGDIGVAEIVSSDAHRILQFTRAVAFGAPGPEIFERSCGPLQLDCLRFGLQASRSRKKAEKN